jgi:hypothetical protein
MNVFRYRREYFWEWSIVFLCQFKGGKNPPSLGTQQQILWARDKVTLFYILGRKGKRLHF